jgi:hypothetical protein
MGLQQFEQRLERLVEGAFAKALKGELQPVELGRRLTREMDLQRSVAVRGIVAPNSFEVSLSAVDFDRFGGFVDVLARELVEAAREHAKSERYTFVGPIEVAIDRKTNLAKSAFHIVATVVEGTDPTMGWLILGDGRRVDIADQPVVIGRLADCTIPINDPSASRRHAQISVENGAVFVTDLNSTNGTKVNGRRIERQRLASGDLITIGTTSFRFEAIAD